MIFETDLDYEHLNSFTEEELFQYIEANFISSSLNTNADPKVKPYSFKQTYKLMKVVCGMLKIQPSNEQWVFLLADCERLLCEACAGAGKTTMAQLRAVKDKLIHRIAGNNILALAYNRHAVEDMVSKHKAIIERINKTNVPDIRRDTQICCHTFHSFCKSWIEDFKERFGIQNVNAYLLSETEKHEAMQMALNSFIKKSQKNIFVTDVMIASLLSLYSFTKETLAENDQAKWNLCPSISDLSSLTLDNIASVFAMYNKYKTLKHKLDFEDLVDDMFALCQDPAVMRRIRTNYQVFILDEYQDFTPNMLRIVRLIMEGDANLGIPPFDNARMTCIGDGDQSIYGFRGTDPDNCIRFKDMFNSPGHMVKVTAMSENRRCPEEILNCARPVIESNTMRINKPIRSIHTGGMVDVTNYQDVVDEMNVLIGKLKLLSTSEYRNTCICYRNQSSSFMLGLHLVEAGIPFHIAKGHAPLTDKLSQSLFEVLDMLSYPDITSYAERALFKVLPKSAVFTKAAISQLLADEEENRKKGKDPKLFFELPFPDSALKLNGFADVLNILRTARAAHRNNKPMKTYVPALIALLRRYYLDWQLSKSNIMSDEYIKYISGWFSNDKSYDDFMKEYRNILSNMEDNIGKGICLTTFHGLKGLEFDNVFIVDLNDNIFPGTELQQSNSLTSEQKDRLECEARRLFYVALTRAKKRLELFFDANLPSRYIRFFTKNTGLAQNYQAYVVDSSGFLVSDIDITSKDTATVDDVDVDAELNLDALCEETPLVEIVEDAIELQPQVSPTAQFTDIVSPPEPSEEKHSVVYTGKPTVDAILQRFVNKGD